MRRRNEINACKSDFAFDWRSFPANPALAGHLSILSNSSNPFTVRGQFSLHGNPTLYPEN